MDYSLNDIIVAPATPPGRGAISLIRISGNNCVHILPAIIVKPVFGEKRLAKVTQNPKRLFSAKVGYPETSVVIDHVLFWYFKGPQSYTGEDMIELSCHGNPLITNKIVEKMVQAGARIAAPGEFTYRAYINDKMDLLQAEAVVELINAQSLSEIVQNAHHLMGRFSRTVQEIKTQLQQCADYFVLTLDFPEEELAIPDLQQIAKKIASIRRGVSALIQTLDISQLIREGIRIPIVGPPNVGKSSLFNWLLRKSRAIVSPVPGTTRDTIEESVEIGTYKVTFIDTAGNREVPDPVEREGVARTATEIENGDIIIVMLEPDQIKNPAEQEILELTKRKKRIVVANKIDTLKVTEKLPETMANEPLLKVSVNRQIGLAHLLNCIETEVARHINAERGSLNSQYRILTVRQKNALIQCMQALDDALERITESAKDELIAFELERAIQFIDQLFGIIRPSDIFERIFTQFCIGK